MAKTKATIKQLQHNDGWNSFLSGLGSIKDKSQSITYSKKPVNDAAFELLLESDGLLPQIIDKIITPLVGIDIEYVGDSTGAFYNKMKSMKLKNHLKLCMYDYLTRGKAYLLFDKRYNVLRHIPMGYITPITDSKDKDIYSPTFGQYKYFSLATELESDPISIENLIYWEAKGSSLARRCTPSIIELGVGYQIIAHLQQEAVVGRFTIPELGKMLLNAEGINSVMARLKAADRGKGVINSILLGKDETFTRDEVTFQNWDKILLKQQEQVSAISGIPVSMLFAVSGGGMNSNGIGDIQNFQDYIIGLWQDLIDEPVLKISKAFNSKITDVVPHTNWIDRIGLEVQAKKVQAEVDKLYFDMGVLDSRTIELNRFVNGFSYETELSKARASNKLENLEQRRSANVSLSGGNGRPSGS